MKATKLPGLAGNESEYFDERNSVSTRLVRIPKRAQRVYA